METDTYFSDPSNFEIIMRIVYLVGIPVHMMGGYCILFKTPSKMGSIKLAMFLDFFWSIWLDLVNCILVVPRLQNPSLSYIPLGILNDFGVPGSLQFYIWISSVAVPTITIVGFFENRYNALTVRDGGSTKRKVFRFLFMFINYCLCFTFGLPLYFMAPDQSVVKPGHAQQFPFFTQQFVDRPDFVIFATNSIVIVFLVVGMLIGKTVEMIAVVALTALYLLKQKTISKATYVLQKKLFISICIQIALPFAIMELPLYYVMSSFYLQYHNQTINCLVIFSIGLHGISSTIAIIVIHKPYRECVISLLTCKSKSDVNAIHSNT